MTKRRLGWLVASMLFAGTVGCGDDVRVDDQQTELAPPFEDRAEDGTPRHDGPPTPGTRFVPSHQDDTHPTASPAEGLYLLTLSWAFAPDKPALFLMKVERDEEQVEPELYALDAFDRESIVGLPIASAPFRAVESDDDLLVLPEWSLGDEDEGLIVPAEANPLGSGAIHMSPAVLRPTRISSFMCGELEGDIVEPWSVEMAGSTFTLIAISDGESLTDPLINCAGDRARSPERF